MHIVLVHGSFHDGHCWDTLTPHLQEKNFNVYAPTLRGHGARRCNPFRVSMHSYARDICEVAASVGEPCVLLGHSMGGFSITAAAERQPELLSRLIGLPAQIGRHQIESIGVYS